MNSQVQQSMMRVARQGFEFGYDPEEKNYYVAPGAALPVRVRCKHWANPKVNAEGISIGMSGVEDCEERIILFLREYLLADGISRISPAGHFLLQIEQASIEGTASGETGFPIFEDINDHLSIRIANGSLETAVLSPGIRVTTDLVEEINSLNLRFRAEETVDHRLRLVSQVIQAGDSLEILEVDFACYETLGLTPGLMKGSGYRWDPDQKNAIVVATGPNQKMSPTLYLVCRKAVERASTLEGTQFGFDLD